MSFNEKMITEKELNIAAILKDKPQNTRLCSPIFGDVYLKDVTDVNNNMIRITHHGVDSTFKYFDFISEHSKCCYKSNIMYCHQLQHLLFGLGLPMDLKV